jgi:hypothetical protein
MSGVATGAKVKVEVPLSHVVKVPRGLKDNTGTWLGSGSENDGNVSV